MKSMTLSPTLFGVDLRRLGQDWAQALALMAQWPGVRWLTPPFTTRLQLPTGEQTSCTELNGQTRIVADAPASPYWGVQLPDELVLWHSFQLPVLKREARQSAIELEVDRLNPFDPQELLWTSLNETGEDATLSTVHIALTSRRLVAQHLAQHTPNEDQPGQTTPAPEVWVQHPLTRQYALVSGFGEAARHRRTRLWRGINLLLIALIVLTGMAAAVTPSLQLRYRIQQAFSDYTQLQAQSAKAVAARENMSKLQARVQQLQPLVGNRMVPEHVLLLLTRYIPEDTYILVLDIKDPNTINLTGVTPNASSLMQHLGRQPGVTKVTAPNPARRERDREVFNIEFNLTPPAPTDLGPDSSAKEAKS